METQEKEGKQRSFTDVYKIHHTCDARSLAETDVRKDLKFWFISTSPVHQTVKMSLSEQEL
jgi:hypothetical protein